MKNVLADIAAVSFTLPGDLRSQKRDPRRVQGDGEDLTLDGEELILD